MVRREAGVSLSIEVWLFYKSDVDMLRKKKLLFPEMCNFSAYPLALHS